MSGVVDSATVWAAYRACDVFVMPNIQVPGDVEGFGVVALEACLAERCVMAADLEGIRDAIQDGENGLLVPPGDAGAQSTMILRLLKDNGMRDSLGRRARDVVVDKFDWSRIADEYITVFERVRHQYSARL
jgi:glycosyltransferase involved in cell wall biosynthesis